MRPVTTWDPFLALSALDRELDEIICRTWGVTGRSQTGGYQPVVDVGTEGGDVLIRFELPGVDPAADVDIEVAEGRLVVSGRRPEPRKESAAPAGSGGWLLHESRYGAFRRTFTLPEHVSADDVEATYDRGVLLVRVRNVIRPTAAPRRIPVGAAGAPAAVAATPAASVADH